MAMRLIVSAGAALFLLTCASAPAFSANGYQFTTIEPFGAVVTVPTGINSSGQVAGYFSKSYFNCCDDYAYTWQGFWFSNGNYIEFGVPGARWTKPLSINDSGQIFGVFFAGNGPEQAFAYDIISAQFTTLPINLAAVSSLFATITAISPSGSIVAGSFTGQKGFIFSNGQLLFPTPPLSSGASFFMNPVGVNSAGEIVGTYNVDGGGYAAAPFIYSNGDFTPFSDTRFTPTAIGPSAQILGSFFAADGLIHGAIYQNGTITLFDAPNASPDTDYLATTSLNGINTAGQIVGNYNGTAFVATPPGAVTGEKTKVFIDSAITAPIGGTYQLAGWAIDNDSAIVAVSISIDGAFVGNASYGGARGDVCAVYPSQIGCPNVGWTFPLDTTIVADGAHTLEAIATSADGTHASASTAFTVANATLPPANPLQMYIDVPSGQNASLSGKVTFSGWAFDPNSQLQFVTVTVDANVNNFYSYGTSANYGIARPDVCAALANANNCLNSGWTLAWDTKTLANGPHTLTVTALALNGDRRSITTMYTVLNSGPIRAYIDQPNSNTGPLAGSVLFTGWVLDDNSPIGNVQLVIDGQASSYAHLGGYRPDVCAVYSSSPDCPKVGWSMLFDTTQLANGTHTLAVTATSQYIPSISGYDSVITVPVTFTVNNHLSPNTTRVYIDQPNSQAIYWGQATFSGWAIDDATRIQFVQVFIDGRTAGHTSGSAYRPDVCALYPNRPGCPYVGWSYSFDTSPLANGVHTLAVTALSEVGSQASVSTTFTVNNANGDSTKVFIDSPNAQTGPVSGQVTFAGWASNDSASINNVLISVDGQPIGLTTPTVSRQDVCDLYPDVPGCPLVGWAMAVDTTLLANGVHKLSVTATTHINNLVPFNARASENATASTFFTVANSLASSPIKMYIDTPNSQTTPLSGVTSFSGWAIDSNTLISSVSISVDGGTPSAASYGVSRPDVCSFYPSDSGCPAANVGWAFAIDTTVLANGSHTVNVTATSSDGLHETISAPFTVSN